MNEDLALHGHHVCPLLDRVVIPQTIGPNTIELISVASGFCGKLALVLPRLADNEFD